MAPLRCGLLRSSQQVLHMEGSLLLAAKEADRLTVLRWAARLSGTVPLWDILQVAAVHTAEVSFS